MHIEFDEALQELVDLARAILQNYETNCLNTVASFRSVSLNKSSGLLHISNNSPSR